MADAHLRIVLFADTHLGFDYPLRPRVSRRRRGRDFFDNFHEVLRYSEKTRPDLVVHGGDFFFRSRVPQQIVDTAYQALYEFAETGIPVVIVPGNHERSRMPESLWLKHPNILVFDRPRTFRISLAGHTAAVSGFPFVRGDVRGRFKDILAQTGWADVTAGVRLLCMHHAVEGAQVGPSGYTFRDGKDVIRVSEVPDDFAAVLAGHVHRGQVLRGGSRNGVPIFYPGSVERTSFAEKDESKGFLELVLTPDEAGRWRVRVQNFIQLPTRPMVDLRIGQGVSAAGLGAYLREQIATFDDNAIVRLKPLGKLDAAVRDKLTASFLRSVFPRSMSVQVSAEIYRERGDRVGHTEE
jgi:DNA repair exonuclease SbcCD nuclease subunit